VLAPDVVRLEDSRPHSAVVWTATGSSSSPVRDDLPMPANAGPWRATLVSLESPVAADDRIDFRP